MDKRCATMRKIKWPYNTYKVVARVKSVHGLKGEDTRGKGPCRYYRPGDEIIFDRAGIKGIVCYSALASMMYKIVWMRLGFKAPWMKEGVSEHTCPDAGRPVIFELRIWGKADKEAVVE